MKSFSSYILAKPKILSFLFSFSLLLSLVSIANASTTISTDINTGGNLTVAGTGNSSIAGFLGIGTTSPSYKLDVAGFINTDMYSGYKQNGVTILFSSSTTFSTMVGLNAGSAMLPDTQYNTAVGHNAFKIASSSLAVYNTAVGFGSLSVSTTGNRNAALGAGALYLNTTGYRNTAVGQSALQSNTTGYLNTAIGNSAMINNTTGSDNTATGQQSLVYNTTGSNNIANGSLSAISNRTGSYNIGIGVNSLYLNTTGSSNIAIGYNSFRSLKPTSKAITAFSDYSETVAGTIKVTSAAHGLGTGTTANVGIYGTTNYDGVYSVTKIDANSFYFTHTWVSDDATGWFGIDIQGKNNTALGYQSGYNITTGSYNLIIGSNVNAPSATADQQLNIGNVLYGTGIYGGSSVSSSAVVTGNIGVSTTTPYAKLSIQGTDVASTTLSIRPVNSQTANILDVYNTAGVLNSVINSSGNFGIGTSSPASLLHVSAGTSATTTVEFGAQAVTSKTCFNVRDALGAATSFYFVGTAMVVEANRCK